MLQELLRDRVERRDNLDGQRLRRRSHRLPPGSANRPATGDAVAGHRRTDLGHGSSRMANRVGHNPPRYLRTPSRTPPDLAFTRSPPHAPATLRDSWKTRLSEALRTAPIRLLVAAGL